MFQQANTASKMKKMAPECTQVENLIERYLGLGRLDQRGKGIDAVNPLLKRIMHKIIRMAHPIKIIHPKINQRMHLDAVNVSRGGQVNLVDEDAIGEGHLKYFALKRAVK